MSIRWNHNVLLTLFFLLDWLYDVLATITDWAWYTYIHITYTFTCLNIINNENEKKKNTFLFTHTNRFSMLELFSFWGVISFRFISLSSCLLYLWCLFSANSIVVVYLFFFFIWQFLLCCFFSFSLSFPLCVNLSLSFVLIVEHTVILSTVQMSIGNVDTQTVCKVCQ